MTRQLSIGAQLAAIKDLRLAEVGRENFADIHTWYTACNTGKDEHCDTSDLSDKIVERISAIFHEHF
jgi:hypothetical protein